jgi:hypothetical protein
MKGVLNMRIKKGLITISTIAVVILGVFFAVRFIGAGDKAENAKLPEDSIVTSDNSIIKDNNKPIVNEESNLDVSESQSDALDTEENSTNEMDADYRTDKTNVGIYTVKKDDTVFSIVNTYMPSHDKTKILEFIKNRNGINDSYKISEGQKIVIPYEKAIETSVAASSETNTTEYTIKKEDTLTSIAKNNMPTFSVKHAIEMIKETNKIKDENAIKEGTLINIPK